MTMKNKFLVFLLLITSSVLFYGCNRTGINYENDIVTEETLVADIEIMESKFLFNFPKDIFISDSLLIVYDIQGHDDAFHIFRKETGEYIKSFGHRGRGPGEIIDAGSVDCSSGKIVVCAPNQNKIVVYELDRILSDKLDPYREIQIVEVPNFVKKAVLYDNGYIIKGNDDRMRYGIWIPEQGLLKNIYTEYPKLSTNAEINWSLTDYASRLRLSPDCRKLVSGSYIGCVLEILDIQDDGCFGISATRYFYEPIWKIAAGAVPKWAVPTDETIIGFQDISLTQNYIYGLVWGIELEVLESGHPFIVKFDYSGTPKCKYFINDVMLALAVDSCDKIAYGIVMDSDGECFIGRMRL